VEICAAQLINRRATGALYISLVTYYKLRLLIKDIYQFTLTSITVMFMYLIWVARGVTEGNIFIELALGVPAGIATCVEISIVTEPVFRQMVVRG
jgi:hypothetical protein